MLSLIKEKVCFHGSAHFIVTIIRIGLNEIKQCEKMRYKIARKRKEGGGGRLINTSKNRSKRVRWRRRWEIY